MVEPLSQVPFGTASADQLLILHVKDEPTQTWYQTVCDHLVARAKRRPSIRRTCWPWNAQMFAKGLLSVFAKSMVPVSPPATPAGVLACVSPVAGPTEATSNGRTALALFLECSDCLCSRAYTTAYGCLRGTEVSWFAIGCGTMSSSMSQTRPLGMNGVTRPVFLWIAWE